MGATAAEIPVVLIVEDHGELRGALRDWIADKAPGVSVSSAGSVQEALETVAKVAVDVVLMDIGLPGMNGVEGTRQIRLRAPGIRVVMLSRWDDAAHVAAALDAGAVAFVSKRRMCGELLPVLRALLEERPGRAQAAGRSGGERA